MTVRLGVGAVALAAMMAAGCAALQPIHAPKGGVSFTRTLPINGHALSIHFADGPAPSLHPLLLFTTGDGGWRGKDLDLFRKLVALGYPIAGFSAPEYVNHLQGDADVTTPAHLAGDYAAIAGYARRVLKLPPQRRVVLVGVSRGAGLEVVAAGQRRLRGLLGGVVAIGLTKEEEHVHWFARPRRFRRSGARPVMLAVYEYLPRLGALPLSVIQSTHDNYLPAAAARQLFGRDTDRRQFHAIAARNHSFSGARNAMYDAVRDSIAWIEALLSRR